MKRGRGRRKYYIPYEKITRSKNKYIYKEYKCKSLNKIVIIYHTKIVVKIVGNQHVKRSYN